MQPFGLSWKDIKLVIKARKLIFWGGLWVGSTVLEVNIGAYRKGTLSKRFETDP